MEGFEFAHVCVSCTHKDKFSNRLGVSWYKVPIWKKKRLGKYLILHSSVYLAEPTVLRIGELKSFAQVEGYN